jgi:protein tyrosine phosphatase (PTP) superfamily phosphohydrolase (DUF442 family)
MNMRPWQTKILLLVILLSLAVFAVYHLFLNERIDTVVEGRVYRSAQLSRSSLLKIVEEKGIKGILNLRGNMQDSEWHLVEKGIADKKQIALYDIALPVNELPGYKEVNLILDVLMESEKPILIHCRRGSDRTGMVSALAIALEQDPPLSEVKKQFSWRYGVLPLYQSIGPYFFSQYEQWLAKGQRVHTKDNLLYWIRNEYVDQQGNLEVWIEHVNGREFRANRVTFQDDPKKIVIDGWAADIRTKSPIEGFYVVLDNRTSLKADFHHNRPDVAKYYEVGKEYQGAFPVGWDVELNTEAMSRGCHAISLKYMRNESTVIKIPTDYQVCF